MSKPARPAEPASPSQTMPSALLTGLRAVLLLAYPLLAHLASAGGDGAWAALAMADLVLLMLLGPLLQRRPWALLLLAGCLLLLWRISLSRYALLPLLLPPMLFLGLIGWFFGRTLRPGRVPLITQLVEALHGRVGMPMTPDLYRYARRLTVVWAVVLALLALCTPKLMRVTPAARKPAKLSCITTSGLASSVISAPGKGFTAVIRLSTWAGESRAGVPPPK